MSDLVAARTPYIDGAFVSGEAGSFDVIDPSTEETVAQVEAASTGQVQQAIAAARQAFDTGPWPRRSADERAVDRAGRGARQSIAQPGAFAAACERPAERAHRYGGSHHEGQVL